MAIIVYAILLLQAVPLTRQAAKNCIETIQKVLRGIATRIIDWNTLCQRPSFYNAENNKATCLNTYGCVC